MGNKAREGGRSICLISLQESPSRFCAEATPPRSVTPLTWLRLGDAAAALAVHERAYWEAKLPLPVTLQEQLCENKGSDSDVFEAL